MSKAWQFWPGKFVLAITVLLGSLPAVAQTTDTGASPDYSSVLLVPLVVTIVVLLVRALLRRKAQQMMYASSDVQTDSQPDLLKADEVHSSVLPEFSIFSLASDLSQATDQRIELEKAARKELTRAFVCELQISLAYLLTGEFFYIAAPFAFIALLRYLIYRNPSRAHTPGLAGCLGTLIRIHGLVQAAGPRGRFAWHLAAWSIAVVYGLYLILAWQFYTGGVLLLLAAALHLWLLLRLRHRVSQRAGLKLLVLRVFGIQNTMSFTFSGLLEYWRFFGPYFMVADPVLLKQEQSRRSILLWLVIAVIFILSITIDEHVPVFYELPLASQLLVAAMFASGIGYIYYLAGRQRNARRFVRSLEDLKRRVAQLSNRPLSWNLIYKTLPMFCFANTWRVAVAECIGEADAVLMDLRGFSQERKGCEYEVDYLFDAIAVERIVFIVDGASVELVQALILDKWRELRVTSPNLHNPAPRVTIYQTSKENRKDMQGIMDLLLSTASGARGL